MPPRAMAALGLLALSALPLAWGLPDAGVAPCSLSAGARGRGTPTGWRAGCGLQRAAREGSPTLGLRGGSVPGSIQQGKGSTPSKGPGVVGLIRKALGQDGSLKKPVAPAPRPMARAVSFYQPFNWLAAVSVMCYIGTSLGMTLINKHIFSVFSFPLVVTGFQLVVSLVLLWVLGVVGQYREVFSFAPPPEFSPKIALEVLPLTTLYIAMLATTNYCLKCVDISFYQVLRSLVIPINLFYALVRFGSVPKASILSSCLMVVIGFVLGTTTELNFTLHGFSAGVISSFFVAMYSITVKQTLPAVGGSTWRLMQYTTLLSLGMIAPVIVLTGEGSAALASPQLAELAFWGCMCAAGVLGFLINLFFFLLIKFASPLSTHISGCVKAALQTVLSVLIFGNTVRPANAAGIILTLIGSALYSLDRFLFKGSGS